MKSKALETTSRLMMFVKFPEKPTLRLITGKVALQLPAQMQELTTVIYVKQELTLIIHGHMDKKLGVKWG